MKFIIVFALAVAYANAAVKRATEARPPYPETIRYDSDSSPDGTFQYIVETENGIKTAATGTLLNPNTDAEALQITGEVQYSAPEGTPIQWTYVAGPNGYEPKGAHIPTPPPTPESVLRALAYIAANPPRPEATPLVIVKKL